MSVEIEIDRDAIFHEDGRLRGLTYSKWQPRRGAILAIAIGRKNDRNLMTSQTIDGRDFHEVNRQLVFMIAEYYAVPRDHPVFADMLNSKEPFLRAKGLTTRTVCYEQLTPIDSAS